MLYQRVPKLFTELTLARGDGRYARILRNLAGVQLLILDDWGLEPLNAGESCSGMRSWFRPSARNPRPSYPHIRKFETRRGSRGSG